MNLWWIAAGVIAVPALVAAVGYAADWLVVNLHGSGD